MALTDYDLHLNVAKEMDCNSCVCAEAIEGI
jgi:hypothetical protein